jgi:DNA polymerase-1
VTLCDTAPVPATLDELDGRPVDYRKLLRFAHQHGFKSLAQRLEPLAGSEADAPVGVDERPPSTAYATIGDLRSLDEWLARAASKGVVALSFQTSSASIMRAEPAGIGLAVDEGEAAYLPLAHKDDFGTRAAGQPSGEDALARLRTMLEDPAVLKIGHDLKHAVSVLARLGIELAPYDDTMLLSYVMDGAGHGHEVAELASLHLHRQIASYDSLCGTGKKRLPFDRVPIERAAAYAAEIADVTLRLHGVLKLGVARAQRARVYEAL